MFGEKRKWHIVGIFQLFRRPFLHYTHYTHLSIQLSWLLGPRVGTGDWRSPRRATRRAGTGVELLRTVQVVHYSIRP